MADIYHSIGRHSVMGMAKASGVDKIYPVVILAELLMGMAEDYKVTTVVTCGTQKSVGTILRVLKMTVGEKDLMSLDLENVDELLHCAPIAISRNLMDRLGGIKIKHILHIVKSVARKAIGVRIKMCLFKKLFNALKPTVSIGKCNYLQTVSPFGL